MLQFNNKHAVVMSQLHVCEWFLHLHVPMFVRWIRYKRS